MNKTPSFVIICPSSYKKNILHFYRSKNSFSDVKFLSKEELIDSFYGKYQKCLVKNIMNNFNEEYLSSCSILKILPFLSGFDIENSLTTFKKSYYEKIEAISNKSKSEDLNLLQQENELLEDKLKAMRNKLAYFKKINDFISENNELEKDEYLAQFLKNKTIKVYGYSRNDFMINKILSEELKLTYEYENDDIKKEMYVNEYSSQDSEISDALNSICLLLDKNPNSVNLNDIYIMCPQAYLEKVKLIGKRYNLVFNGLDSSKIIFSYYFKEFEKKARDIKDIEKAISLLDFSDEKGVFFLEKLKNIDAKDLDFESALKYFKGELSNICFPKEEFSNAINVITSPIFITNKNVFVLGFSSLYYPNYLSDSTMISDEEREVLGIETISSSNNNIKEQYENFFRSENIFKFYFSKNTQEGPCSISSLNDCLELIKASPEQPLISYSLLESKLLLTKMKDIRRQFDEEHPLLKIYGSTIGDYGYCIYENDFKGEEIPIDSDFKISHSSFDKYHGCPFSFYLAYILKIDPFEETFNSRFGNFSHFLLEESFKNPNFDFETLFEEKKKDVFTSNEERFFVDCLKTSLKIAIANSLVHKEKGNFYAAIEKSLTVTLSDNKTKLTGKIDKILYDETFCFLVDYKTGKDSFKLKEVPLGYSLQLPTYGLLIEYSNEYKDKLIGGFYINNIIPDNLKSSHISFYDEKNIPLYLRLNGLTLNCDSVMRTIDPYFPDGKGFVSFGRKNKTDDTYTKVMDQNEVDDLLKITEEFYITASEEIKKGVFKVSPKIENPVKTYSINPCKRCTYKDICFVKPEQKDYFKKEIQEDNDGQTT